MFTVYGVLCKNFDIWYDGAPYGDDWTTDHIDMVADAGGNYIYYDIDYEAWVRNDSSNYLGIPFHEYLAEMVRYGNTRGVKSVLGCSTWYRHEEPYGPQLDLDGYGVWSGAERKSVIMAAIYAPQGIGNYRMADVWKREAWIQWGREMVTECNPWGLLIMDEPPQTSASYPMTEQDYWDFANECITEWHILKPNLRVFTYNGGGSRGNRNLTQFHANPLHKPNGPHNYIHYVTLAYAGVFPGFDGYQTSHEAGKAQLLAYLQNNAIYGDIAALTVPFVGVEYPTSENGNWAWYCEDFYEFCFNNCYGLCHFCMVPGSGSGGYYSDAHWNMLTNDGYGWTVFGQFWVDSSPTLPTQCFTDADCLPGYECHAGDCVLITPPDKMKALVVALLLGGAAYLLTR